MKEFLQNLFGKSDSLLPEELRVMPFAAWLLLTLVVAFFIVFSICIAIRSTKIKKQRKERRVKESKLAVEENSAQSAEAVQPAVSFDNIAKEIEKEIPITDYSEIKFIDKIEPVEKKMKRVKVIKSTKYVAKVTVKKVDPAKTVNPVSSKSASKFDHFKKNKQGASSFATKKGMLRNYTDKATILITSDEKPELLDVPDMIATLEEQFKACKIMLDK